jgi:hypothetical protein
MATMYAYGPQWKLHGLKHLACVDEIFWRQQLRKGVGVWEWDKEVKTITGNSTVLPHQSQEVLELWRKANERKKCCYYNNIPGNSIMIQ